MLDKVVLLDDVKNMNIQSCADNIQPSALSEFPKALKLLCMTIIMSRIIK